MAQEIQFQVVYTDNVSFIWRVRKSYLCLHIFMIFFFHLGLKEMRMNDRSWN